MASGKKDPTEPIRLRASRYPGVDQGTACTQSSFKAGGKAFLYIGEQGGRYKAMFKLAKSLPEATRLAAKAPEDFQLGPFVTARFSAEEPLPKKLWETWLDESYALATGAAKPASKPAAKRKSAKKATKKKAARKRSS